MRSIAIVALFACGLLATVTFAAPTEPASSPIPAAADAASPDAETLALADIGRVWGFLKYHHPGVMKGAVNWDGTLIGILEAWLAASGDARHADAIGKLLDAADATHPGPLTKASESVQPPGELLETRDSRWLDSSGSRIPEPLRQRLVTVLDCQRPRANHWIGQVPNVGNTTFNNELKHAETDYPDTAYRLLGLFRFWNAMEYFFPYKGIIGVDWGTVLEGMIPKFRNASDATAYHLAALELSTRIEDSHAAARSPLLNSHFGKLSLPFRLRWIEGKTVVVEAIEDLIEEDAIRNGDVVIAIDGVPLVRKLDELRPLTGASNERGKFLKMHRWLIFGDEEEATIRVARGGEEVEATVRRYPGRVIQRKTTKRRGDPIWTLRDDGIGHVDMARFLKKHIPDAMKELESARGIIFDMRAYPDFLLYDLLPHLSAEARPFAKFTMPLLDHPGVFVETPPIPVGPQGGNPKPYPGKVVVLVNETTVSRAEFITMAFQTVPGAKVIGIQTAGADGNVSMIPLPGQISVPFTGIGVFYPDGTETQRVGVRIDIPVELTIAAAREGRDEVLERAVRYIDSGE